MKKLLVISLCCISLSLFSNSPMNINRGYLFAIEGTEGCGKTTLLKNLAEKLSELNLSVVTTREPGSTELGKTLRSILMNRSVPTCTLAEFLLFAADRAQHFEELIMPQLAQHKIIICDRMADSSIVYQGYVKGLDIPMIATVNSWAMQYQQPDLVFYLKLDCITAMERINHRNTTEAQVAFEQEILQKKQLLIDGFDAVLESRANVVVIDAKQSPEVVAELVLQTIISYIQNQP